MFNHTTIDQLRACAEDLGMSPSDEYLAATALRALFALASRRSRKYALRRVRRFVEVLGDLNRAQGEKGTEL